MEDATRRRVEDELPAFTSTSGEPYRPTDRRVRRAPDPEWVLMYRRGLSRARIADLVRAPHRTVSYHLAIARALDPSLDEDHDAAAAGSVERLDQDRVSRVTEMIRTEGRYPSTKAADRNERRLAEWLGRLRRDAAEGILDPKLSEGLAVLPDWHLPSRTIADEVRWQQRLSELVKFRAEGNDWPRHKNTDTSLEHVLGVWLHGQRSNRRHDDLGPEKQGALDRALPGWHIGRTRGRKSRE